jgi:hypothetical protein
LLTFVILGELINMLLMNEYNKYIITGLLAVAMGLLVVFLPRNNQEQANQNTAVNDFISCSVAGYTVMESYPRQCATPDGQVYVEDLSAKEQGDVVLETPVRGQLVTSPLTVSGKARGNWFFEANLPVTLKDENGKVLAQVGAMTADEWMTTDYANFTTVLQFEAPTTEFGLLLVERDNPSGLPENDKSYAVPVRFR